MQAIGHGPPLCKGGGRERRRGRCPQARHSGRWHLARREGLAAGAWNRVDPRSRDAPYSKRSLPPAHIRRQCPHGKQGGTDRSRQQQLNCLLYPNERHRMRPKGVAERESQANLNTPKNLMRPTTWSTPRLPTRFPCFS